MPITHQHVLTGAEPTDPNMVGPSEWNQAHTSPAIADVTGLQSALDAKSTTGHTHAQSDITNLVSNLAAKEATANKGVANGYASLGADGKVPSAQLPASGADPWIYLVLAADFTTSSNTTVDVTGLAFTPLANLRYEFSGIMMARTATATVMPRTGLAWPTGMTDGVAAIDSAIAAGSQVLARGNINAALLIAVSGLPNTTQSWSVEVRGMVLAGAAPSGTIKIQLASETAGTNVTLKAGSFLRYRTF